VSRRCPNCQSSRVTTGEWVVLRWLLVIAGAVVLLRVIPAWLLIVLALAAIPIFVWARRKYEEHRARKAITGKAPPAQL
jgi:hypothetical protein